MTEYIVIKAGPGVQIHKEEAIGRGFDSVAEAHAFIEEHDLSGVQIVATGRRSLTSDEQLELAKVIVEAAA